jgi:dCTP deaminase
MVEGRSTYARWGLSAHVTAPLIEPAFYGNITLEMYNHGKYGIDLTVGKDTVCQLILYEVSSPIPEAVIEGFGRYRGQTTPEPQPYNKNP